MPLLSPGDLYKKVPKKFTENLDWRAHILKRCESSRRFRQAQIDICKHDYIYRLNTFVFQHNPDAEGEEMKVGPFITYDFQDRAIRKVLNAIEDRRDLCIEKSRDMGASWICIYTLESIWNALPNENLAFVSRDLDSVSDGTTNSLFGKLAFYHRRMPEWLVPECKELKGLYKNESNDSKIIAEASTGKALVGARVFAALVDEYSQIDAADKVDGFTADATKCRIFNFTHTGIDTAAYRLTMRPDVLKLVMHWTEHPEKARGLYKSGPGINDLEFLDKKYSYPPQCPVCKSYRDKDSWNGRHRVGKPTYCHEVPAEPFTFVLGGSPGGKFPSLRSPWYDEEEVRRCSKRYMAMNLDIDPKGSSDQFFDPLKLRMLKAAYAKPPLWNGRLDYDPYSAELGPVPLLRHDNGLLELWFQPKPDGTVPPDAYFIGIDPSEGRGKTPSCVSIINRAGEKVAAYVDANIAPEHLAPLVVGLANLFRSGSGEPARMVWEVPGPGHKLGDRVIELGFRNFHYHTTEYAKLHYETTDRPGFYANAGRKWLMETYRESLQGGTFVNRCEKAIDECLNWRYNEKGQPEHPKMRAAKDDPSGAGDNHGDRSVADSLCDMLRRKSGFAIPLTSGLLAPDPSITSGIQPGSFSWRYQQAELARIEQDENEVWV